MKIYIFGKDGEIFKHCNSSKGSTVMICVLHRLECNTAVEKASLKKEEVLENTKEMREKLEKISEEKKVKKKEFNKIQK